MDDFASFEAGWEPKPDAVRRIVNELGIGLDSVLYVDDNPAEREALRRELPEVDVLRLPADPAGYVRALAEYPLLESAHYTEDDARRTEQYRARSQAKAQQAAATDLPSFWRSLGMRAAVTPIDSMRLPRAAQLIAKTNQFNLTSRRHNVETLKGVLSSDDWVHLCASLSDRFAEHGIVGLVLARQDGKALEIDTLLMSCRVIGRTLERSLLAELASHAQARDCRVLRGILVPTERNAPAHDFYPANGFRLAREQPDGSSQWEYDLGAQGAITNDYIEVVST
jgi:FkbH-like protein